MDFKTSPVYVDKTFYSTTGNPGAGVHNWSGVGGMVQSSDDGANWNTEFKIANSINRVERATLSR
jgi:hypothetical protein